MLRFVTSGILLLIAVLCVTADSDKAVFGGRKTITNDVELKKLEEKIHDSLTQLSNDNEQNASLQLLRIISASSSTVSGKSYDVEVELNENNVKSNCLMNIWEQPWLDSQRIEVTCGEPKRKYRLVRSRQRKRRDSPLIGGLRDVEADQLPALSSKLIESLDQLRQQENGADLKVRRVLKAQKHVVTGTKYVIVAELESQNQLKNCTAKIWEKLWEDFQQTDISCEEKNYRVLKSRTRRSRRDTLIGGPTNISGPELDELKGKLIESFAQLSQENGTTLGVSKIYGATKQVVAGVSYTINAELSTPEGERNCVVKIWEKLWLDFRQVDVDCGDALTYQIVKDGRQKRSFVRPMTNEQLIDQPLDEEAEAFRRFTIEHGRNYADDKEYAMRLKIFKQNLFMIRQLNKFEMGTAVYDVTDFADLTFEEYRQRTGLVMRNRDNEIPNPIAEIPDIELPKSFDWRDKQVITSVKNQGGCGSCWAFSVTGNIEGLHAIKTGKLESYSEQELVDCDTIDAGCNGGLPDDAYKAIESIGGLELEDEYPYTAKRSKVCRFNGTQVHVRVKGAIDLPKSDEVSIAKWLSVNGPVSIGINANAMQFYRGGISHPWKALCRSSSLDHGVLLVGFGVSEYPMFNKTMPYWIVKNSWGPRWGEQGYYRVFRGDNTCGVASMASSAVLE